MSNIDIENLLASNKHFRGVFSRDVPMPTLKKEEFIVINLDSKGRPGSHWVSLFKNKEGDLEYHDSFGLSPPEELGHGITFSTDKIQNDDSVACGFFAIYYPMLRIAGNSRYDSVEKLKAMPQ